MILWEHFVGILVLGILVGSLLKLVLNSLEKGNMTKTSTARVGYDTVQQSIVGVVEKGG